MKTMKDMYEFINEVLFDGKKDPKEDIFKYSPTGELSGVFAWFEQAKQKSDFDEWMEKRKPA